MKNPKGTKKEDPKIKTKEAKDAGWNKLRSSSPPPRSYNFKVPGQEDMRPIEPVNNKEIQVINIKNIHPNPRQPRKIFNTLDLQELADSINQYGLLEPILVRPKAGAASHFEIIAGERRFRACLLNDLKEVTAVVKIVSDNDAFAIALSENVVRKTLNPIEEAMGYKKLLEMGVFTTQTEMAERMGIERTRIVKLLGLFNYLSEDAMNFYLANEDAISQSHLDSFMRRVPINDQVDLLKKIKESAWSVKNTRQYVAEKYLQQKSATAINPIKISEKSENHFDISVHIRPDLLKDQLGEILGILEKQIDRIKVLANARGING